MSGRRPFPAGEWPRLVSDHRRRLAEPEHYVRAFPWPEAGAVLDLGAGPGFFVPALLAVTRGPLIAVDRQPAMLARLRERLAPPPRVRLVVADLGALPFPSGRFAAAWCAFALHEVPDPGAACVEAMRVLAPGAPLYALEWDPVATDHGPPVQDRIGPAPVVAALEAAGCTVSAPRRITGSQWALVATRPASQEPPLRPPAV